MTAAEICRAKVPTSILAVPGMREDEMSEDIDMLEVARQHADLTDPEDPYPAELVGQLSRHIVELTADRDAWQAVGQRVVDAFDPLKARAAYPEFVDRIVAVANDAHASVLSERDSARRERDEALQLVRDNFPEVRRLLDEKVASLRAALVEACDIAERIADPCKAEHTAALVRVDELRGLAEVGE